MPSRSGLFLGCCLLGIAFSFLPFLNRLELPLYDLRIESMQQLEREGVPRHPSIQLIGIDEATAHEFPDWGPAEEARVGANLAQAGARGVLLLRGHDPVHEPPLLAVQKGTGIFSQGLRFQGPTGELLPDWDKTLEQANELPTGSLDFLTDPDRVVRKAYLALDLPGKKEPLPAAALLMFARLNEVPESDIHIEPKGIHVGSIYIPTAPDHSIYVRVLSPKTLDLHNMTQDVTREYLTPLPAGVFLKRDSPIYHFARGRIFLMGEFLYQATDQVTSTLGRMKNLQFQACVLDTLMGGWYLQPVPTPYQLALLVFFTLFAASSTGGMRPFGATLVLASLAIGLFLFSYWLFTRGWLLNITRPLVAAVLASLLLKATQLLGIMSNLRKFGGTSAFEAARSLDESHLNVVIEREATIVFCNLPDLLRVLEQQDSPDYFKRRQEFSVLLNEVAMANRGIVLDFQGDAPMLGFGTDQNRSDPLHAYHGVRAALDIVSLYVRLCYLWPDVEEMDLLRVRCGVATGPVALGQVGARKSKLAQAAIGDTTNVAARLMGAARKRRLDVLVTATTQQRCDNRFDFQAMDPIPLKGKAEPVPVAFLGADV